MQNTPRWYNYALQSTMATGAIFLALLALRQQNLVAVASLAATAFTVFSIPGSVTASTRNVLGGHAIGLLVGGLFTLIPLDTGIGRDITYAAAAGSSMFLMAILNTEHPPAAGTALSILIFGFSGQVVLGVATGVVILAGVHRLLRRFLYDLIDTGQSRSSRIFTG